MSKRDFNKRISSFRSSISGWTFYSDFEKASRNIEPIKYELNLLNSLVGSKRIEEEFLDILQRFPSTLSALPILIAKREKEIKILDCNYEYTFNFQKMNYSYDDYLKFMRKTGLFDLLENKIVSNLYDYVLGVEVGMDTNGRKNRTGQAMESLVESYLQKAGLVKNKTYFVQMNTTEAEELFNIDLSGLTNGGKNKKIFDFVVKGPFNTLIAIETNFYSSGGSKLNETARSYEKLANEAEKIPGFMFVWITDGEGWTGAKHNLEETFDVLPNLFNIKDLENGAIDKLLSPSNFIENRFNK